LLDSGLLAPIGQEVSQMKVFLTPEAEEYRYAPLAAEDVHNGRFIRIRQIQRLLEAGRLDARLD